MCPRHSARAVCRDERRVAQTASRCLARNPVKNVTAGSEMAAPGHHGPLFSTEIEHKLHPGSHGDSPNVSSQYHFPGAVASEKINKEYVCKYIQRRQNVSDRAVNDNAAGSREECVFIPLEGNDLYPS